MGFDLGMFIGDVDEEFICTICSGVFENPLQFPKCEHSFCEQCIKDWLTRRQTCPIDREHLTVSQLKPVPRVLRNLLSRLPVKCRYSEFGCTAKLTLEQLDSHQNLCPENPSIHRSLIEVYENVPHSVLLRQNKNILLSKDRHQECLVSLDHNFLEDKEIALEFLHTILGEVHFREYLIERNWTPVLYLPRQIAYYGPLDFHSGGIHLDANDDWPPILECIRECIQEYLWPGGCQEFNSVFLNLFRDEEDKIGWHNYSEMPGDDLVAIVLLGDPRYMELKLRADRHRDARFHTVLEHGSLFVMYGGTISNWLYRIPKEDSAKSKTVTLVFRKLT